LLVELQLFASAVRPVPIHFHDEWTRRPGEVDPGHVPTISPKDHLGLRLGQTGLLDQLEKAALEERMPSGAVNDLVQEARAVAARSAKRGQPTTEKRLRRAAVSDRTVHRPLELGLRDLGRHPNDRGGRRGASEQGFAGAPVDEGHVSRRPHDTHRPLILLAARHEELDWSFGKAVEMVEGRGGAAADKRVVAELELTGNEHLSP
jgi:hypothetical protein